MMDEDQVMYDYDDDGCQQTFIPEVIHTYPEMNETIKDLLSKSMEPMNIYILARIKELEAENEALKKRLPLEDMESDALERAEQDRIYRDVLHFIGMFTANADGTGYRQEVIEAFTHGGCYWFAFILFHRFMMERYEAEIVIDPNARHFGCKIGNKMVFDITGEVTDKYEWMPWEHFGYSNQREVIITTGILF